MINERIEDLVHSDLDGELEESVREELESALAGSEEARRLQRELQELQDTLSALEPLEPPPGLHKQILDGIVLPGNRGRFFSFLEFPGFVRYGLTAAAGLLLAVGLYEFRPGTFPAGDLDNMVGTIMKDQQVQGVKLDTFSFDIESFSSTVSLLERDDGLVLEVRLDSEEPIEITMDFTSDGLMFDAIAQMQSDLNSIEFADQAVQVKGHGRQHFAVMLHREDAAMASDEASIKLQFSRNGNLVKEGVLLSRKP